MDVASIPVSAAKAVAEKHGYDQVIIIARKVGTGGGESVATYGVDQANCDVAARVGDFIKQRIMQWPQLRVSGMVRLTRPRDLGDLHLAAASIIRIENARISQAGAGVRANVRTAYGQEFEVTQPPDEVERRMAEANRS